MTIKKWLIDNADNCENLNDLIKKCMLVTGSVSAKTVKNYYYELKNKGQIKGVVTTGERLEKPEIGISISQFRDKHDPNVIISKGLKKLPKDRLIHKTSEMKLFLGLPVNFSTKDLEDMCSEYHGKNSDGVFWGVPEIIQELKSERILR